jgi:hypothetical protein
MIIRAKNNFVGTLDISSPEVLADGDNRPIYRGTILPGETRRLPDDYYQFPNIRNAVACGYLEIVAFESQIGQQPWSLTIDAELSGASGIGGSGLSGYSGHSGYSGFTGISGFSGLVGDGIQESPIEVVCSSFSGAMPIRGKIGRDNVLRFPPTGVTSIDFGWDIPEDLEKSGNLTVVISYVMDETDSGTVVLKLESQAVLIGQDTTTGVTFTQTRVVVVPTTTLITSRYDFLVDLSSLSNPITDYEMHFTLSRQGDHPSDTHVGNFVIGSISIMYTGFGAAVTDSGRSGFSGVSGGGGRDDLPMVWSWMGL